MSNRTDEKIRSRKIPRYWTSQNWWNFIILFRDTVVRRVTTESSTDRLAGEKLSFRFDTLIERPISFRETRQSRIRLGGVWPSRRLVAVACDAKTAGVGMRSSPSLVTIYKSYCVRRHSYAMLIAKSPFHTRYTVRLNRSVHNKQ